MLVKIKKNKKIAVTGADGFIGKKLCHVLESRGYDVLKYNADNLDIRNKIEFPENIEVVYHLAALNKPYFSKENPLETFKTNVLGTLNVLEAAKKAKVKKIIFTSSVLVYKNLSKTKETDLASYNGIYPYGFEKIVAEEYVKMYSNLFGIDYVILRITGAYGPGMVKNPIFDIIQGFIRGNIKLYVNKNSIYNFIYIDDIAEALAKALDWKNEIFNIASDEKTKLVDVYEFFKKYLKKDVKIEDAKPLVKISGNNQKIKKRGWKIKYPLEKGLVETYKFLLNKQKNETK
jgi:UDP-glucose 4-epimerase